MKLRHCAVVVWLLSILALGQNSIKSSKLAQSAFHGIKVFSSNFDGRSVQLDFMNDSPANITAWGYCVKAEKTNSDDPDQSFCTWTDPLPVAIDRDVQEQLTMKTIVGDCPDCHFIHPGEHKTISATFSWPVASAEIELNLILYANGTSETKDKQGASAFQEIARGRQNMLRLAQLLVGAGQAILDDQTNQHPTVSMMNELQSRIQTEPALERALYHFKRPEWRKANNAEFTPTEERSYLSEFVTEQQMKVVEFSQHQVQEVK